MGAQCLRRVREMEGSQEGLVGDFNTSHVVGGTVETSG